MTQIWTSIITYSILCETFLLIQANEEVLTITNERNACNPKFGTICGFSKEVDVSFDDQHSYLLDNQDVMTSFADIAMHWLNDMYKCMEIEDFFTLIEFDVLRRRITNSRRGTGKGNCKWNDCPKPPNEAVLQSVFQNCWVSLIEKLQRTKPSFFADISNVTLSLLNSTSYDVANDGTVPTSNATMDEPVELGDPDYSAFGDTAAMSDIGNYLVVGGTGILQLYRQESGWEPGHDFSSHIARRHISELSISFSRDGNSFIVGAPATLFSQACVFNYVETSWTRKGNPVYGTCPGLFATFGSSVAISDDSNTIAVADRGRGNVKVFCYGSGLREWKWKYTLRNQNSWFDFQFFDESWFGHSIAMSGNGMVLIIGAPNDHTTKGKYSGSVSIFNLSSLIRIQVLYGEKENDKFGSSVTMSQDAERIAVSAYGDGGGYVDMYKFNPSLALQYTKLNDRIYVSFPVVFMSGDGNHLLVGSPKNSDSGTNVGKAFIYHIEGNNFDLAGIINGNGDLQEDLGIVCRISQDGNSLVIGYHSVGEGVVDVYNSLSDIYTKKNSTNTLDREDRNEVI